MRPLSALILLVFVSLFTSVFGEGVGRDPFTFNRESAPLSKETPRTNAPTSEAPKVRGMGLRTYVLQYTDVKDIHDSIANLLVPADNEKLCMSIGLNSLTIQASADKLAKLDHMISQLDQPALQVLVEAKIIELKSGLGDSDTPAIKAVNVGYTSPDNPSNVAGYTTTTQALSTALGLYSQVTAQNVTVFLQALDKTVGFDLLSSPWITALNHRPASVLIGTKLGYRTSITTTTGTIQEVKFMSVGVKLFFTPHISRDGYIQMEISPSVSDGKIINELPEENTTETQNYVLVKDGQTIVIGGLTKKSDLKVITGVPILSSIPLLGLLFQKEEIRSEKRDIMVLLTPHIITPALLDSLREKSQALESKLHQ